MLVSVHNCWRFVSADSVVRFEDLVAHESMFGWILSGSCLKGHEESVSHRFLCISTVNHVNESDLHNFWNLESVGINAEKIVLPETQCRIPLSKQLSMLMAGMRLLYRGKMKMKLSLLDHENCAKKRLSVLNYKFEKNPVLKEEYNKLFKCYEDNNIIVII